MTPRGAQAPFEAAANVFLVRDVQQAAACYRDALGFRYEGFWGEPPEKFYGNLEFGVRDRDGYLLAFGQDLTE